MINRINIYNYNYNEIFISLFILLLTMINKILLFKINISLVDLYDKKNGKNTKLFIYFGKKKDFFTVKV